MSDKNLLDNNISYKIIINFTMSLEETVDNELFKLQKLKDNLDWFYSNDKYFKKYTNNQFVAIKDRSFLDKDFELERLIKRLNIENYDDSIAIEFVYS